MYTGRYTGRYSILYVYILDVVYIYRFEGKRPFFWGVILFIDLSGSQAGRNDVHPL
jgi:hypothetical protein